MKTRYFLPALLCLLAEQPSGAQTLTFQRTYGGDLYEDARALAPTLDGGFLMTGLTLNGPDREGDMYLTKINAAGAVVWTRHYGRPTEDGGSERNILELWDLQGRLWRQIAFKGPEVFLYRDDLPAGVYYYAVRDAAGKHLASGQLQMR